MPAYPKFARVALAVTWIVSGLIFSGLGLAGAMTGQGATQAKLTALNSAQVGLHAP